MNMILDRLGSLIGGAGVLVCIASVVARILGRHYLLGFELTSVLLGGVALIAMACLAKLQVLVARQP